MAIILDADAIIKLNRAGVLLTLVSKLDCEMPEAVYQEVVVEGKARRYSDALVIEEILHDRVQRVTVEGIPGDSAGLGPGESAVRELARMTRDAVVISDDRRFLTRLSLDGIAYVTPADVITLLARRNNLSRETARGALEQLRPLIRDSIYRRTREELDALEGPQDE